MSKPKLISFNVCPFVQRSVILLEEKGVDYDIDFIDVYDPPAWFLEISPTGKVPVLQVDDEVLFESTVIGEYIEEVYDPKFHPADPLIKAKNRAWMEYTSSLYGGTFNLMMAKSKGSADKFVKEMRETQKSLDEVKKNRPWFNGDEFSMADIFAAPYFVRAEFFKKNFNIDLLDGNTNLQDWSDRLLARKSVKNSIVKGFENIMVERMVENKSFLVTG
ncbi:MAG: glutathione S-transferase [Cocleimonas sp.]|jgi:glutathione S-transferase